MCFRLDKNFQTRFRTLPAPQLQILKTDSNSTFASTTYTDPQFHYLVNNSFFQTISYFEQDVKKNICNSLEAKKGTIVCKILFHNETTKSKLLIVPTYMTLSLINLLGMPASFILNEFELEVEIFDLKQNKIA